MYCQKCRAPLRLDASLEDLNPAAFKLLADSTSPASQQRTTQTQPSRPAYPKERRDEYDRAASDAHSPTIKRNIPSNRPSGASTKTLPRDHPAAMSFVMLTDSQVVPPSAPDRDSGAGRVRESPRSSVIASSGAGDEQGRLSSKMDAAARLFEILSARSDIDHPICVECADLLLDGLQKRLNSVTKERDAYVEFLRQANADVPSAGETQDAQKDLDRIRKTEQDAFAELQALEQQKAAMEDEIRALDAEARELDKEEDDFWRERNAFAVTLSGFQNERDRVNTRYDHDSKQLERLQRANVYNDTFLIGYDGAFGTINGLRLGRLPDKPVDWAEINAAWGQTCLLLATMADKLGFSFQGYRLNPLGSTSTVDKLEYPQATSGNDSAPPGKPKLTSLDLFCTGDLPLGLGFLHRRFDSGMVAFLDCLRQLGDFVERSPAPNSLGNTGSTMPPIQIPYKIQKDKIGEFSIKIGGFSNEEDWTKACKFTLTNCKCILAYASRVDANTRGVQ